VAYYRNGLTYGPKAKKKGSSKTKPHGRRKPHYTLTFTYTFQQPGETVWFAHCYPYTYTDLQQYLKTIDENLALRPFCKRRLLCQTLAGNRCELLTITAHTTDPDVLAKRPAVFVTARAHPGETNTSFMVKGLIDFLLGDSKEARTLRNFMVFKIVPMLNADGCIHGNYRTSLAGRDLNRRYTAPSTDLFPTVAAVKDLLRSTHVSRGVLLFLDLHGHSRKKNVFLYGCDAAASSISAPGAPPASPEERIFPRVLARLLSNISSGGAKQYYRFEDCCFRVQRAKAGTGRVVAWSDLGVANAFTLEASFCGTGDNAEQRLLKLLSRREDAKIDALERGSDPSRVLGTSTSRVTASTSEGDGGGQDDEAQTEEEGVEDDDDEEEDRTLDSMPTGREAATDKKAKRRSVVDEEEVLGSFRQHTHFSRREFEQVGQQVAVALLHYANLHNAALSNVSYRYISGELTGAGRDSNQEETEEGGLAFAERASPWRKGKGGRPLIRAVSPEPWEPLLEPTVLQPTAVMRLSTSSERARAEQEVRDFLETGLVEADASGSDSEPSADEVSEKVLNKSRAFRAMTERLEARRTGGDLEGGGARVRRAPLKKRKSGGPRKASPARDEAPDLSRTLALQSLKMHRERKQLAAGTTEERRWNASTTSSSLTSRLESRGATRGDAPRRPARHGDGPSFMEPTQSRISALNRAASTPMQPVPSPGAGSPATVVKVRKMDFAPYGDGMRRSRMGSSTSGSSEYM
jgi:hypothetical protein